MSTAERLAITCGNQIGQFDRPMTTSCPMCRSRRLHYAFSIPGPSAVPNGDDALRVVRCAECRFMLLNPQPSDAELTQIYGADYFFADDVEQADALKASTARHYLHQLDRYCGGNVRGRLLEVGSGRGEMLLEAAKLGYDVTGVELSQSAVDESRRRLGELNGCYGPAYSGRGSAARDATGSEIPQPMAPEARLICSTLEAAELDDASYDVCILSDVIEHARDPLAMLRLVRKALKPDGVLLIATPSLDSWSAKLLKRNWMEFKPEHLSYFDRNTIQNALFLTGFNQVVMTAGKKTLSLDYVAGHCSRFPVPVFGRLVSTLQRWTPKSLSRRGVQVVASGMTAICRVDASAQSRLDRIDRLAGANHTLSVVVPAFNEAATVERLLQNLLRKQIANTEIEIIVVESNSTDGTRQVVQRYAHHPRVKVILEDRPRGKGHAVRTGLTEATGDFVLIQDADLEYDLEDYDVLLEPLAGGREALVLGSRHGGDAWWKMRQFESQPLMSAFLNFGHWVFTTLLNVLFRQKLKDPFTMYKVFRRDCLTGLDFKCNRFDFDYELLVKMIRKGYKPIEIPVNYRSRSFKEGKKVSTFRDPINWLRALAWLRVTRINPMTVMARQAEQTISERLTDAEAIRKAA